MEHKEKHHKNEEWMQKIMAVSEANKKEHPAEKQHHEKAKESHPHTPFFSKQTLFFVFLALLAFLPRLYFIFFMSHPENAGVGWNGDTYHHWQIGYLTYTTGLDHGFLRLWDLKGMEYFWGPLDPLLLTALFAITGSENIVITRILSTVFGVGSVFLLSLLANRFWGKHVAVVTFLFAMFFPIAIQSDASGMLEPLGVFFMLLGIYLWPRYPLLTGIFWAIATMVRAEAWLFSIGLLIGILFTKEESQKKGLAFLGWIIVMLIYMKYLLDSTGNAVYPVYWNFLANGIGTWADPSQQLTSLQTSVKPVLMTLGVLSALILAFIVYKRPKNMLLLLLGVGNIFFVTAFMGFGHYIKGWEWWFPLIRFFVFPYIFTVMLLFAGVSMLQKWNKRLGVVTLYIVALIIILVSQFVWSPLMIRFNQTAPEWDKSLMWGKEVGKYYEGGTLLFPEGDPNFTYTTVQYGHVNGEKILGQMFDPFYYLGQEKAFDNWEKNRKAILVDWIKKYDIRLAIIGNENTRYKKLIEKEPTLFEKVDDIPESRYSIWRVYPERIDVNE